MIPEINDLAMEAYKNAVDHGFWSVSDAEAVMVSMLHCELSEAFQADREDQPLIWYEEGCTDNCLHCPHRSYKACYCTGDDAHICLEGRKPEGVAVELADFVICLMGYAAGNEIEIPTRRQLVPTYDSLPRLINNLHSVVCDLTRCQGIATDFRLSDNSGRALQKSIAANAIELVENHLSECGINLWKVVRMKMDFNRTRAQLHGKSY